MLRFELYYDKDAEEDWLREMSLDGWAFKKFFLGFYTFEPCNPGEYNYQIDLLDSWNGEKEDYESFMKEAGIDIVGQWWRWVYLQKKAADGPFELYTDKESKISHYSKIRNLFIVFAAVEIIFFFIELMAAMRTGEIVFSIFAGLLAMISFAMLRIVWKCHAKIEQLRHT